MMLIVCPASLSSTTAVSSAKGMVMTTMSEERHVAYRQSAGIVPDDEGGYRARRHERVRAIEI
jgi:hypothetical protein